MILIKYGSNQQGIREVQIQPQLVNGLMNKEVKKKPELKKTKQITKEETPEAVSTPSKKNKTLWKPKKKALNSTTTPSKKITHGVGESKC